MIVFNKIVIIDADILRSAGGINTQNEVSLFSSQLLSLVLKKNIKVGYDKTLFLEWKHHKSRYSSRWLSSMISKRKLLKLPEDNDISSSISDAENLTTEQKRIALKDSHLISNAINSDKIVISKDDRARTIFCLLKEEIGGSLIGIYWISLMTKKDTLFESISNRYAHIDDECKL
ncbi:hypothetical protein AB7W11_07755 [Providencia manganoxydans]|uniref:hypothetical protein n=1 Tax=Providencia manganoxydans TaxID=2923283 RepID=UPI0034E4F375